MAEIQRFDFDTRIHHGVVHNGTVYLTGQVGTPGTSAEAQMQEVLDKIDRLLAKAGSKRENILHVQMWLDDIRDFDAVNRVWDAWITPEHAPARSSGAKRISQRNRLA